MSNWPLVAGNMAVVALFVLLWSRSNYWLKTVPRLYRAPLFAAIIGLGAIASMSMAVESRPGVFADLRIALLTVVALFGGWPAALITALIAGSYRLMMGGLGTGAGVIAVGLASASGLFVNLLVGTSTFRLWHIVAAALIAAMATSVGLLALPITDLPMSERIWFAAINLVATVVAGLVYLRAWHLSAERELLAAALTHAPDYAFVKDLHGKFAAANEAAARLFGVAGPDQLIGRDNFDVEPFERAQAQLDGEATIMASGEPQLELEEQLTDADGTQRWYATTKVPLHDIGGRIIGLAGVSRDITETRLLQQEVLQSRDTLSYALAEMTGGLAMYDSEGRLVFCNEQYRDGFPLTGALRQPGAHYRDILQAVIDTGEQPRAPTEGKAAAAWIADRYANLQRESEDEIYLSNDRWMQVRTRPTSNGTTMVVAIDVTRFKQAEQELHTTTDHLKHLVRTDALTGLLNRRAFDDAIDAEIRRTSRAGTPLSLLIVDVDRFKDYNDHYGHLAGDEALRQVSQLLKNSLKRPADVVARFGGEEFTAILPDTDEDGAYLVAESFRRALAEAHLSHANSDKGYITVSVGVATYMADTAARSALDLIETADGALYSAKAAGRDRVFGTRVTDARRLRTTA